MVDLDGICREPQQFLEHESEGLHTTDQEATKSRLPCASCFLS